MRRTILHLTAFGLGLFLLPVLAQGISLVRHTWM